MFWIYAINHQLGSPAQCSIITSHFVNFCYWHWRKAVLQLMSHSYFFRKMCKVPILSIKVKKGIDTAYKSSVPNPKNGHLSTTSSEVAPHSSALFYPNRAQLLCDKDDIVINQRLVTVVDVLHVDVSSCLSHILDVLCFTVCMEVLCHRDASSLWPGSRFWTSAVAHQLTSTVVTTWRQP